jgi:FMN phosphatase YigB (HAD superfamily)
MKVDAYHNIQVNTVYFGREPLENTQKLLDLHNGTHISPSYMRDNLVQLNDMFSLPEICLLADIIQYFKDQKIQFHPRNLYNDVRACAESIHAPSDHMPHGIGILHSLMIKNIDQYLKPSPNLVTYLSNLRAKGKKTFLLTNSAYSFV